MLTPVKEYEDEIEAVHCVIGYEELIRYVDNKRILKKWYYLEVPVLSCEDWKHKGL